MAARLKEEALALARDGQLREAVGGFTRALEAWRPEDGSELRCACLQNRGICHQQLDQLSDALEDFTQAVAVEPENPAPYVNRGGVLFLLSDKAAARECAHGVPRGRGHRLLTTVLCHRPRLRRVSGPRPAGYAGDAGACPGAHGALRPERRRRRC